MYTFSSDSLVLLSNCIISPFRYCQTRWKEDTIGIIIRMENYGTRNEGSFAIRLATVSGLVMASGLLKSIFVNVVDTDWLFSYTLLSPLWLFSMVSRTIFSPEMCIGFKIHLGIYLTVADFLGRDIINRKSTFGKSSFVFDCSLLRLHNNQLPLKDEAKRFDPCWWYNFLNFDSRIRDGLRIPPRVLI